MSPPPEIAAGVVEHPEIDAGPTAHAELDVAEVKRRAVRGVGSMFVRSLGQRGLQMIGNILLARWLAPKTIGLYAIVSFFVGFAGFLSDLGLGASLIQRKENLDERAIRAAFTLNFLFNSVAVGSMWFLAPLLVRAYHAPSALSSVRVMALTIFLSTFTMVPSITLERSLRFTKLAFADLAGQVAYLATALALAVPYYLHPSLAERNAHGAVWVFVWATVASRAIYTVIILTASRWRIRFGVDLRAMRELLSFGLPYQLNGFVNALKDNFVPLFVGFVAGARAVGFITWAVGLATNGLFLMPIVQKVTFPTFSRLQHDKEALKDTIEKSIKWVAATVIPTTLLLMVLARQIVEHVYGPKWLLGLPSFYLLCIPMINASFSTVMVSALYGLGKAKTVLRLTVVWALAGWGLGVPLTLVFHQNGFALAMCIVSCLSYMSVLELNKIVKVRFVPEMIRIFIFAGIPAAIIGIVARFVVHNAYELAAVGIAGVAMYLGLMYLGGELEEVKQMLRHARAKDEPTRRVSITQTKVALETPEGAIENA